MTPFITGTRQGDTLVYVCPRCQHQASLEIFRRYLDLRISVQCTCGFCFMVRDDGENDASQS